MIVIEWFDSLTMDEKVLAVSTIFSKNKEILDNIKNHINQASKEKMDFEGSNYGMGFSNYDYLQGQSCRTHLGYQSLNSMTPSEGEYISKHVTFLGKALPLICIDTNSPEDTLSLHESILENSDGFFEIIERNK